ncbi:MAG: hypothetical protein IJ348_03030 [Alistipes sp.]|nr:hypothetical protein [Alistipes sp.]
MKNIWKSLLFSSALLLAGLNSACTSEKSADDYEKAVITVEPGSFAATVTDGATEQITITTNGIWSASIADSVDDNVTVEPAAGQGNAVVTVTVPPHAARTFTISFKTERPCVIEGFSFTSKGKADLTIYQNDGGVDESNYIYYEDCGTSVKKGSDGYWPYTADFTGWSRNGDGQSGVTYGGSSSSIRNSGPSYDPTADATYVSGIPYVFINNATAKFEIGDIVLDGTTENYSFSFSISAQDGYTSAPSFATPSNNTVQLELSVDGNTWAPATFTTTPDGGNGWYHAVAEFKVPAGSTALHARFSGYNPPSSGGLRLDDFKLISGGDGDALAFPETVTATIAQITTTGIYSVKNATVVATYARGVLLTDSSKAMLLAYLGEKDLGYKEGDVVNIEGSVTTYNTSLQFGEGAKIEKVGTTTVNHGTPVRYTYEALEEYGQTSNPEPVYAIYTGKLSLSSGSAGQTYYNILFDEGNAVQGSIQYPRDAEMVKAFEGKYINVTGYLIGWTSSGKYISTMYTSIEENGNVVALNVSPASLSFGVDGGSLDVSFSSGELGENKIFAELTGTNADKFTCTEPANGKVIVTATANTSDTAYNATLTIYIAPTADGERAAEKSVQISQSTPNASSLTLSAEDIAAIDYQGANNYTQWNYVTATGEAWSGIAYPTSQYLQLGWNTDTSKAASTSYLMTPSFGGKSVAKITITPNKKTTNGRNFVVLPDTFVYNGESASDIKKVAYAVSDSTVKDSTTPLTIDMSGVTTTTDKLMIRAVGGAAYVDSVKIEFAD